MQPRRLDIPPCDPAASFALEDQLGCSAALAQVLVRRGLGAPDAARAWLEPRDDHPPEAFAGIETAVALVLDHARSRRRITVHGDYDVDGVCSTAILVRALRGLGADVDWYLPSRTEDGYGLSVATVDRLAARGTALLITADCGITAVEEVAHARSLGLAVIVTDHHSPRADGTLPEAPIIHPAVCGYPFEDLCATAVVYKLAAALMSAAGCDAAAVEQDLDLVALATVADCVPLHGENRRLVRDGLRALAGTRKEGLRALMRVARVDQSRIDAGAIGFRLAPRINAAGRLNRADAGLELLLTQDAARAQAVAEELDRANMDRRQVETAILFEAEAQVAAQGERAAYVLAGEGWHPGVVGIVAARIAERHHRPAVVIALDGEQGTASGRSIPAFDLLGGLDAAAAHLVRHGGHRAAAGATIRADAVGAFRAAFTAHAELVLTPADLVGVERVDAVVGGDELGIELAQELASLAPFGNGNPPVSLLVPACRLVDARPMGEGKHLRFTVESGGVRARAVAFGTARLPEGAQDGPIDATFALEINEWRGAVEPRLVLRHGLAGAHDPIVLAGEPEPGSAAWTAALWGGAGAQIARAGVAQRRTVRDRRGGGVAGTIAAAVHSGAPVLVVVADAVERRAHLNGLLGGFALVAWDALAADPALADAFVHLVALDPPLQASHEELLGRGTGFAWRAWGQAEVALTRRVVERDLALRPLLVAAYRALDAGTDLAAALAALPAARAHRVAAVLTELELVEKDLGDGALRLRRGGGRVDLHQSRTFAAAARDCEQRLAWLAGTIGQTDPQDGSATLVA